MDSEADFSGGVAAQEAEWALNSECAEAPELFFRGDLKGYGWCRDDDGVILAGDAAGLAYPESGEGIRPAVESGLLAAATIRDAAGCYSVDRLEPYGRTLRARFGQPGLLSRAIPPAFTAPLVPRLFATPWFVRHLVLDRWFLHADRAAFTLS